MDGMDLSAPNMPTLRRREPYIVDQAARPLLKFTCSARLKRPTFSG